MTYTNPSGAEPMATMGASDKRVWPLLGGIGNRLTSAYPVQDNP